MPSICTLSRPLCCRQGRRARHSTGHRRSALASLSHRGELGESEEIRPVRRADAGPPLTESCERTACLRTERRWTSATTRISTALCRHMLSRDNISQPARSRCEACEICGLAPRAAASYCRSEECLVPRNDPPSYGRLALWQALSTGVIAPDASHSLCTGSAIFRFAFLASTWQLPSRRLNRDERSLQPCSRQS